MRNYKAILSAENRRDKPIFFQAKNLCSALIVLAGKIAMDYKDDGYTIATVIDRIDENDGIPEKEELISFLPTNAETEKWFEDNIGIVNDCSASSAIYKFRLWLKEREKLSNY